MVEGRDFTLKNCAAVVLEGSRAQSNKDNVTNILKAQVERCRCARLRSTAL